MPLKILVVDDNDMNRELLRDILTLKGYEILEGRNGKEAISLARQHLPDLILMDVQMPVMNGMAAVKILKADPLTKDVKIISLTAYAAGIDQEEFMQIGFDDYLSKPISISALTDKVEQLIGWNEHKADKSPH